MADRVERSELVQGTLDMLVLRTLAGGPLHGYAIARRIQQSSGELLKVEEGSLYPALHRMERRGWIVAHWGVSEAKRKAKYYQLTAPGRTAMEAEMESWNRFVGAVAGVLHPGVAEA